jgi:hypothetical protein
MTYGEILESNERGQILIFAALLEEVRCVVEVGTLDGTGSTRVIYDAQSSRSDFDYCSLVSLEAYSEAHALASQNFANLPRPPTLLHGCLLGPDSPLLLNSLSDLEANWLSADRRVRFESPNVIHLVPERIDLLVLDGGEFTSFNDYLALRARTKWLYLDDCEVRKNRLVLKTAQEDGFRVIKSSSDGNGVALLRRWY